MKPIDSTITEESTLTGREVQFTIGDPRWVMRSMSDLYSDRALAVIREYSTNARDAMIEAGRGDQPIAVTLPDAMNTFFKVQDFGVGMTEDELAEIYTKFGTSTKRASDDFNGMLGFGCKSAVAYTNTFSITAVKHGIKTGATVTRHKDFSITLQIHYSVPTDEANGVTVEVPVHNHVEFATKAKNFYHYWPTGTVLVNGKFPDWAVGEKIDDDLYYSLNGDHSYVVMGNVPYPIVNPSALFKPGMRQINFVAYVETGAVEFTPNREALKYSDHTKARLHKVIDDFCAKAIENAKREIANATSHYDAYQKFEKWKGALGGSNLPQLSYKGTPLASQFPLNATRYIYSAGGYRYRTQRVRDCSVEQAQSAIFITNFPSFEPSSSQKGKAREWKDLKGLTGTHYYFTMDATLNSPWVNPSRVVAWETLKAELPKPVKAPRAQNVSAGRLAGSFDLLQPTSGVLREQDVPTTGKLYWIAVQKYNKQGYNVSAYMRQFGMTENIVIVPANRLQKFLRNYPHAVEIFDHFKTKVKPDGLSLLSKDAQIQLSYDHFSQNWLSNLDATKVDDPAVCEAIRIAKLKQVELLKEYKTQMSLCRQLGVEFKQHNIVALVNPLADYELLKVMGHYNSNVSRNPHLYFYLNSVYKAKKAGKAIV